MFHQKSISSHQTDRQVARNAAQSGGFIGALEGDFWYRASYFTPMRFILGASTGLAPTIVINAKLYKL